METKKMVMIPGPTPVVKAIQEQMGRETQAFGDPRFVADYRELIAENFPFSRYRNVGNGNGHRQYH